MCFCWKSEADATKKGGRRYDVAKVGHLSISLLTLDFILFRSELLDEGYRGDLFVFDCTFCLCVCVCKVCVCVAMCVGRK